MGHRLMAHTRDDLTAIWRECVGAGEEFIGPVEPPMTRWLRLGSPKDAWEIDAAARHAPAPVQLELPWEIAA